MGVQTEKEGEQIEVRQMSSNIIEIKKRLKEAIKETKGLNQTIVAKKVGISQPYLNEILNHSEKGSLELFNSIAKAVGLGV